MALLENKKIVITGGSMGIGLTVAKKCAQEGACLALISRHQEDLKKVLSSLAAGGQKHRYFAVDVSNSKEVGKIAQDVAESWGHIDGLVNCAGVYGPIGSVEAVDPSEFAEAIKINLLGTFYVCHHFIPLLKKSSKGKIVNYSGGGAAGPFPNYSAYAASKAAVVRLTENLAKEFETDHIDVNAVAPGFVVTRLHQQTLNAGSAAGEDFLKKTKEQMEKGGAPPGLAADLTAFLLSSESDGISGKFISAVWDKWRDEDFRQKLQKDADFATLRRIDDKMFCKKIV